MSDVLSAEEVGHLERRLAGRLSVGDEDLLVFSRLVRSHEQLRAERDAAVESNESLMAHRATIQGVVRRAEEAEAAARAGGCAADLAEALRQILGELGVPGDGYPAPVANAVHIARDALAAFDRAVSGQTAEKEEA